MNPRAGVPAIVLAAALLVACGGENAADVASSSTLTRVTITNADDAPSSGSSATREPATTTVEEPDAVTELVGFTSPSGNVGCIIDSTYMRCDVSERDWTPPPRPADCEFDYGQGISMSAVEQAEIVCAGDTAQGASEALEYGESITKGPLSCDSAESGITCRDSTTGHGFMIAREAYEIF